MPVPQLNVLRRVKLDGILQETLRIQQWWNAQGVRWRKHLWRGAQLCSLCLASPWSSLSSICASVLKVNLKIELCHNEHKSPTNCERTCVFTLSMTTDALLHMHMFDPRLWKNLFSPNELQIGKPTPNFTRVIVQPPGSLKGKQNEDYKKKRRERWVSSVLLKCKSWTQA
jgi:hypothetical protein